MGASCFKPAAVEGGAKLEERPPSNVAHGSAAGHSGASAAEQGSGDRTFKKFTLDELTQATDRFGEQMIVSEGGRQAQNVVYKGRIKSSQGGGATVNVAVKRFSKREWEDAKAFSVEAQRISQINHPHVTELLGFCAEGDDRLLVSEYMSNKTLAQHLFHWEHQAMPWLPRLDVAVKVATALDYLRTRAGSFVYHDLNPYRVLLDEAMEPKLSCFGLIKSSKDGRFSSNLPTAPPELYNTGIVTPQTVVYMFGYLLLCLFSGKSLRPLQFVERAATKMDMTVLLDSQLADKPGAEQAMELVPLIAECLQNKPEKRPDIGRVSEFLALLQSGGAQVPRNMADQPKSELTFQEAAVKNEYSRIHELLASDDLLPGVEPSLGDWNPNLRAALKAKEQGKVAFLQGNWERASSLYTEYIDNDGPPDPVVYIRRSFAFMQQQQWAQGLEDAIQALQQKPGWVEGLCLQGMALREMGKEEEASRAFAKVT